MKPSPVNDVLERLGRSLKGTDPPVQLVIHRPAEPSGFSRRLERIAETIRVSADGGVVVQEGDGSDLPALPCLTLSRGGRSNINYMALPDGPEAAPFAGTLLGLARGDSSESDAWARRLAGLDRETELLVFIAAACPHCPKAVEAANRIALANGRVTTTIIDAQQFPSLAERYGARSVPATLINGGLMLTGVVSTDDIVDQILAQDMEEYEARVFRSLVESGRFVDAAAQMRNPGGGKIYFDEWKNSVTSTRLGLMLAAEEALLQERTCMDGIVPDLVGLLHAFDAALRGDTADLLGRIAHPSAESALREALGDPNADVAEIAAESLEQIRTADRLS